MIFNYKKSQTKKWIQATLYTTCLLIIGTCAFALNNNNISSPLTARELSSIIAKSHLQISVMPEVITEINNIRGSKQARESMSASLARMNEYKPYIVNELNQHHMPSTLLALPLVISGYNINAKSPHGSTGIWQFIPSTAHYFGLKTTPGNDDRLNVELDTKAAIQYLTKLHDQFHDWRLAVMGYEIGEDYLQQLIDKTGSHEAWVLARSPYAPAELKQYLAMYDTAVVIINNPQLIS